MEQHNFYEDGYSIENSIHASTGFIYPQEDNERHKTFDVTANDIIIRLASVVFCSNKPKVTLAALLYAAGHDVGIYLGVDNTLTDVARALGETKQTMSVTIQKMKNDFNLKTNTGKVEASKEVYSQTNYRKKKIED